MKKYLVPVLVLVLLFLVVSRQTTGTKAWFRGASVSKGSVSAATLNFKLGGEDGDLNLDLGEVVPGQSGTIDIPIEAIGTIPGSLCVTNVSLPAGLVVSSTDVCSENVDPGGSIHFLIDWILPAEIHGTDLGGEFNFSYTVTLVNGYTITKYVTVHGTIFDSTDTPTATPTETVTPTETETAEVVVEEPLLETQVDTETPTPTETATATPVPTDTPTATETPTLTSTDTVTETATTETPTETVTNTSVPTDMTDTEVP